MFKKMQQGAPFLVLPLALIAVIPGAAQTVTGDITGVVSDATGAVIPNATITATNVATNVSSTAKSNETGQYILRFLQIGTYKVTITAPGFATQTRPPFTLEIGQVAKIDAKLNVGSDQVVQVSSDLAPILNTENGTLKTTISETLIKDLPINGHNFQTLAQYAPGVNVADGNQWNGATGSPNNSGERTQSFATLPNVNGNRTYANNYLLDGISIIDSGANIANGFGVPAYNPSAESIKEVSIVTTNPPAEYGDATGGQFIQVMKSGTNDFHGSLFFYLQNYLMDANTFGAKRSVPFTPRGQYTQKIYGATFGGPVIIPHLFNGHDKLFFFVDYQGYRKPSGGIGQTNVPLNAWRGNTSGGTSVDPSFSPLAGYAYFGQTPSIPQLYDTQNGNTPFNQTINGITYQNLVPIRNPVAKYLFAHPELWPLANHLPSTAPIQYNYQAPTRGLQRNDQADIKVDYKISAKDSLFVRVSGGEAWDGQSVPITPISFPAQNDFPFKQFVGNYTRIITPNIVNEFRAGYTRIAYQSFNQDVSGLFKSGNSLVGIPASGQAIAGFSAQTFSQSNNSTGTFSVGTAAGGNIAFDNHFYYADTVTVSHGLHNMKFGAQIFRIQNNFYLNNGGLLGGYSYSGSFTGNPKTSQALGYDFADFVLNYVTGRNISLQSGDVGERQYRFAIFAQDDYKMTPKLTVNYGLRWQYDQPVYEVNNKIANVDPHTAAVILAGINGKSRSLYDPHYDQFNPRLGFSYQATPRAVVRGGFGITTFTDYNVLGHTGNAPFHLTVSQTAVTPTTSSAGTPFDVTQGFPNNGSSTYTAWGDLRPQWVPQWNLTTEYQVSNTASVVIGYVGEIGQHLSDIRNINQYKLAGVPSSAPFYSVVGNSTVKLLETEAYMNFNALEAQYRQRPLRGLEFTVNYTYSKNLSDSGGPIAVNDTNTSSGYPQDNNCLRCEYGPTGSDTRHMFNWTARYELPFGRGRHYLGNANFLVDELLGGWNISANSVLLSGFPNTIIAAGSANVGTAGALHANHYRHMVIKNRKWGFNTYQAGATNQPAIAGGWGDDPSATHSGYTTPNAAQIAAGAQTPNCATAGFDDGVCAYGQPAAAVTGQAPIFGNSASGTERAPGYVNYDASVGKLFRIYNEHALEFKCSAYNVGNISSYNNPGRGIAGSSTWGLVQSTRSQQRQLELQLSYKF